MTQAKLRISELKQIFTEINSLIGIDFSEFSFFSIKRRFEKIFDIYKFENANEFITKLKEDKYFLNNILFDIFPSQTELFRDPTMWLALLKNIFPKYSKSEIFKIYIPHCTSGEELFSLVYLLHEAGMTNNTEITVSTPCIQNIEYINRAVYPIKKISSAEKNVENLDTKLPFSDFVTSNIQTFEIKDEYFKNLNIKFDKKSVFETQYTNEFDLVIFRNVMIYFNSKLQDEILEKITNSLKRNSYLAIGIGEKLTGSTIRKYKISNTNENIYKKTSSY